jgi:4-hydroxybenzoate polyprenyltransferase
VILLAWLEALRPKQWTKNLLVFAGLVFSQHLGDWPLVVRSIAGFLSFSLLAGSVYVLNDLRDVEADRQHPKKRRRPIASGRLPVGVAWVLLVPTVLVAGVIAWWLGTGFVLTAAAYLAVNFAYSYGLKHQVVLDVFLIAIGFVLRAIAGVQLLVPVTTGIELSPWLLVCTFFGALFLALAKRRREIVNAGSNAALQREVLNAYTPEVLDGMVLISAAASVMGYALYTIWPATVAKFHTEALLYTVPFVSYGIFRYLYLVRVAETTEDPSMVLLTDRPLALCVGLYLAAVIAVLYRP